MRCRIYVQGDRFGDALDGAARQFSGAYDSGLIPMEFVNSMRKQHKLILGIGHRVKSVSVPFQLGTAKHLNREHLRCLSFRQTIKLTVCKEWVQRARSDVLLLNLPARKSRHESGDHQGLCSVKLPSHTPTQLCLGGREDHHFQGRLLHNNGSCANPCVACSRTCLDLGLKRMVRAKFRKIKCKMRLRFRFLN